MRKAVCLVLLILLTAVADAAQRSTRPPRVEIPDSERRTLCSKRVGEELKLHVYLPRGYPDAENAYPVVYLLDSEYSFGCVAYVARRLIKGGEMPPALVVGVSYELPYEEYYERRQRDYTPTDAQLEEFPYAGSGPQFLSFLREELIPFVNATYRTDPDDRTLIGYSFSGLFCAYAAFTDLTLFNRYVMVSPSLWWDHGVCFRYEEAHSKRSRALPLSLFLTAGEHDGRNVLREVRRMAKLLDERGYQGLRLSAPILDGETHRTIFPRAVTDGLRFVFADSIR
jgi:predicted alpha/beta superfamily hydrolase